MSQHLPLVAAQPGIWMAEKLSDLPSAWSVAHYVELTGEVDAPLLARAVVAGLAQADTLRMRFTEDNGEVWQWVDDAQTFELPEIIDLRTNIDPHGTARALMQADLQQDLRVDSGKPLVFHQLIQVADNRWYWYQRYHHLLVDGFSFPAITRQIANIYCAWLRGEPTPASPFTPFADVVEEYQQYRESEAWQRDAAFWAEQRRQLPPPASLSPAPLPGRSASADILRLNTRNIQLVIKYLDIEYRTEQRFLSCRSPAVTDNLFGIVTLMTTHFFQLCCQSGCQFRQRFLCRNVNTQRQNVEHGSGSRQRRRAQSTHKDKSGSVVHAVAQSPQPQGCQRKC